MGEQPCPCCGTHRCLNSEPKALALLHLAPNSSCSPVPWFPATAVMMSCLPPGYTVMVLGSEPALLSPAPSLLLGAQWGFPGLGGALLF